MPTSATRPPGAAISSACGNVGPAVAVREHRLLEVFAGTVHGDVAGADLPCEFQRRVVQPGQDDALRAAGARDHADTEGDRTAADHGNRFPRLGMDAVDAMQGHGDDVEDGGGFE